MVKINLEVLRERIDITEVIGEYVSLKQKKDEHIGLCPFHSEKSPSFTVNSPKGVFFCFGCGEKGDAIAFLMSFNRSSFMDTILALAERYDVPVEPDDDSTTEQWQAELKLKRDLLAVNQAACEFFQQSRSPAFWSYLAQRNVNTDTADLFKLGYAPDDWQGLTQSLKAKFSYSLLAQAGLVAQKGDRSYDLFRDRLMVPLCNPQGEVIGFSGRSLKDEVQPKYLNSPETKIFKKSEVIFPLNLSRRSIIEQDCAIVVEGNFDVIRLHQMGVTNAIASLGTAIDSRQLNRLTSLTDSKTIVLALDNDPAGIKATEKVLASHLDAIGSGLIDFKILPLPTGFKDIDEIINTPNGEKVLSKLLDSPPGWIDWRVKRILSTHALEHQEGFSLARKEFSVLLEQIKDPSLRSFYLDEFSKILSKGSEDPGLVRLHREGLWRTLNLAGKDKSADREQSKVFNSGLSFRDTKVLACESTLAKALLFNPQYCQEVVARLNQIGWFICDHTCRWLIDQLCQLSQQQIEQQYIQQIIKFEVHQLLASQEVFETCSYFINLDFHRDRQDIQGKIDKLLSQSEVEILALSNIQTTIEMAIKQLKRIKIQDKINIIEIMLSTTNDTLAQQDYLTQMTVLKKQLIEDK